MKKAPCSARLWCGTRPYLPARMCGNERPTGAEKPYRKARSTERGAGGRGGLGNSPTSTSEIRKGYSDDLLAGTSRSGEAGGGTGLMMWHEFLCSFSPFSAEQTPSPLFLPLHAARFPTCRRTMFSAARGYYPEQSGAHPHRSVHTRGRYPPR